MPPQFQSARAPVEARRHLLGLVEALPKPQQERAFVALEALILDRFGPQEPPHRAQSGTLPKAPEPDVVESLHNAIGNAFSTTFDGSEQQAAAIVDRAWANAERVLQNQVPALGPIARWRLRRVCRQLIARERAQLLQ